MASPVPSSLTRRSSDDALPAYFFDDPPPGYPSPLDNAKIFHVYLAMLGKNWSVTTGDKQPIYYIRTSTLRWGAPDVTVHAGSDKKGPIVAVSNFLFCSSHSKLGIGDPSRPQNVQWEDFTKESFDHSKYRFETNLHGERRTFLWKRTRNVGIEGSKPSILSDSNFKLVDERSGELVGVYANNGIKSLTKKGKFLLLKDYGKDFEYIFFASGFTLLEKLQRRNSNGGS
ncbi:hypothetical protein FQN57_004538 [Myotisia sp. PD_48]|nr:hypothetical protein FQN57_004538 [Myotisia sp. PD_48]